MTLSQPFDTVLVANRGEIALRVMRTAQAHGYRTVAVYSDADADAPHVRFADEAVRLGPAPARDSYLDAGLVVEAALRTGAGAIHPGYGFLSENADFAETCAAAGITFVGPSPEAIRLMGDKAAAKRRLARVGVPLLPGYQGKEQTDDRLLAEAEKVGLPLMVKAAAGGGGTGMRLVTNHADLAGALASARRESGAAFGSDVLILERALARPRHVEVQVLADAHGHVIALGDRDCSIQRRHQKVIEEAPAPGVDPTVRSEMQQAAVAAAKEIGYRGAGTVEFLLDEDGTFAFLEMNTRLQVEHPVTELVTGVDLVEWQLRIAQGEPLTLEQEHVGAQGHAIEARLYAEDPDQDYLPRTGDVAMWQPPDGQGVRVDAGIHAGSRVTADYDPMLAKVVAHGRTREEARRRLTDALERTVLLGLTTNRSFLARITRHPAFAAEQVSTAFLTENDVSSPAPTTADVAAVAGALHVSRRRRADDRSPGLRAWTNAGWLTSRQRLVVAGAVHEVTIRAAGPTHTASDAHRDQTLTVTVDGAEHVVAAGEGRTVVDGSAVDMTVYVSGVDHLLVRLQDMDLDVRETLLAPPQAQDAGGVGTLLAPMHAAVTSVAVAVGDTVAEGDPVVVLEAMKMEHAVTADVAGTVTDVVPAGQQVAAGQAVATIEPDEPVAE